MDEEAQRIANLERLHERVEARLDGGAKAFDAIRKELDVLIARTAPKQYPIWSILGVVLATLTTVFGVWWQARGEIDAKANVSDVAAVQREVTEHRVVLSSVKTLQESTQRDVAEIKSDVKEVMRRGR